MVNVFSVLFNKRVIFEPFGLNRIAEFIDSWKKDGILIITGKSFFYSERLKKLKELLVNIFPDFYVEVVHGEPSPKVVDEIVRTYIPVYEKGMISLVLGIGGGSVMDTAKAVSAMIPLRDAFTSVKDFLEGVGSKRPPGKKIPYVAVPTTSGTGSEATKNAVISEIGLYKKSLRHDNYVPDMAIIDPSLILSCPKNITVSSGMDALSQLIESYVSTQSNPITEGLSYEGLKLISQSFIPLWRELEDLERDGYQADLVLEKLKEKSLRGKMLGLRGSMALAAYISGITLANAGLGTVHGIAGVIGGMFNAPHGEICGILLPRVMEATVLKLEREDPQNPVLYKFARLGYLLGKRREESFDETESITGKYELLKGCRLFTETLKEWGSMFKLRKLSDFGVSKRDLPLISQKSGNKNNPIILIEEEIENILKSLL